EHGETGKEDASPTDQVAEPPGQEQDTTEGDEVGIDEPGQARLSEAEVAADRGQRDVHDRRVEDDHQHPGTQDNKSEAARIAGGSGRRGRRSRERAHDGSHSFVFVGRQNPRTSSTKTTVIRPGVISRLMIRTLLTALWMPKAACTRASSRGKAYSLIRRRPSSTSGTIFCVPTTRITRPAPLTYGPSWLPPIEAASSEPVSVTAWTLPSITSCAADRRRIWSAAVVRSRLPIRGRRGVEASGMLDRIGDSRSLERLRRAVVDLRSIGDEAKDDPLGFGRVCRPEHAEAVRFEGGYGARHPHVSRQRPVFPLDGWINIELEFGRHGYSLLSGWLRPIYACACTYLTTQVGAYA